MDRAKQHALVLGGARSGKSKFAEQLVLAKASKCAVMPIYLATAQIWDEEMRGRIDLHIARRGQSWTTIESPLDLIGVLIRHGTDKPPILVDCLTLWLTNLMMADKDIEAAGNDLVACLPNLKSPVCFVSNEVGQGIIPDNQMAREFIDHAGRLHQKIASAVHDVYLVTAGIAQQIKGS